MSRKSWQACLRTNSLKWVNAFGGRAFLSGLQSTLCHTHTRGHILVSYIYKRTNKYILGVYQQIYISIHSFIDLFLYLNLYIYISIHSATNVSSHSPKQMIKCWWNPASCVTQRLFPLFRNHINWVYKIKINQHGFSLTILKFENTIFASIKHYRQSLQNKTCFCIVSK